MATDITTLAIALQSKEAESNLKVFNDLLATGSDQAKKMEHLSIGVDVNEALKELAALKAGYDDIAKSAENIHFDLGTNMPTMPEQPIDTTALEELKRELDSSMTGAQPVGDGSSSSISIPYSAKLLRQNNSLTRTVRIQKRILICLGILVAMLIVLLFVKESELRRTRSSSKQIPESVRAETVSAPSADAINTETLPAPESENSGGGL